MASGVTYIIKTKKYKATCIVNGNTFLIGTYDTEAEAIQKRMEFIEARHESYLREVRINRNRVRLTRFNQILAVANGLNKNELADQLGMCAQLINKDVNLLFDLGYLSRERKYTGINNQPTYYYTSLKQRFDMSDIDNYFAEVDKWPTPATPKIECNKEPTHNGLVVYGINNPNYAKKYQQQAAQSRSEYKSPKNYVSGSSMAMF